MVRGSYCQQVMTFFFFSFFFGFQLTARLKLHFQSGTLLSKSLDPPLRSAVIGLILLRRETSQRTLVLVQSLWARGAVSNPGGILSMVTP